MIQGRGRGGLVHTIGWVWWLMMIMLLCMKCCKKSLCSKDHVEGEHTHTPRLSMLYCPSSIKKWFLDKLPNPPTQTWVTTRKQPSGNYAVGTQRVTRCMCAGGKWYANNPDFCKNHQFHYIYYGTLAYVLYIKEFLTQDSRRFTILKSDRPNLLGGAFSAKYLICRHIQTDRQTDRLT